MRFGIWLAGTNKQNKAKYWNRFKAKDLKDYHMIDKIISK
jgi:acetyl-CoA carboxylase alpha subunit